MSEKSINQKIFDVLDIAILAETGLTLNWREAVELRGYIKSLEEAYSLEGNDYRAELARRDEIIKRLREDAERLAIVETEMTGYEDEYEEVYCLHSGSCGSRKYQKGVEFIHTPDCPITLHRALMKELE